MEAIQMNIFQAVEENHGPGKKHMTVRNSYMQLQI